MLPLSAYAEKKIESIIPHQNIPAAVKDIRSFENESRYGVYIHSTNCSFEILINDIPVIKYSDTSGSGLAGSYFPLNEGINNKGTQRVTIKMTPGFNKEQNALNTQFSPDSGIKMKIVKSLKNKTGSLEENDVQSYSTFKKKMGSDNTFEGSFTFFADIPYHIETLENAEVCKLPIKISYKLLNRKLLLNIIR
ncbi:hypothetical protein QWZ06_14550 [Chryseobacterium tructae]|uniref:hypothetical protein n=1 Tax=Chryseobacterium tructae TaxID=1037380 RepID=UPI0025B5A2AA|nr:hypothetical protein [Chryseobacterium tructae]MDN3693417.1 hypothetical protein [Chryseobacterium tructae]